MSDKICTFAGALLTRAAACGLVVDLVDLLRAFFLLSAAGIFAASQVPALYERFVPYGPRKDQSGNSNNSQPEARHQSLSTSPLSIYTYFLDRAAQWQVPHAYFTQFYIVSVASSAFWATQLALGGPAFRAVSCLVRNREGAAGMAPTQVWFCWLLLAVQGTRRLGECIALARAAGKSRAMMWVTHWAIGIAFYAAMGVAVWVEGSGTDTLRDPTSRPASSWSPLPSPLYAVFVGTFFLASGIQSDYHRHLSSLRKYSVPRHRAFAVVVSPHYTAECVLYLSLALLGAPHGEVVNKTLLAGFVFVLVNLGVSAGVTRGWYARKFGQKSVEGKWAMIPGIY